MVIGMGAISYAKMSDLQEANIVFLQQQDALAKIDRPLSHLRDLKSAMADYLILDSSESLEKYEILFLQLQQELQTLVEKPISVNQNKVYSQQNSDRYTEITTLLMQFIRKELSNSRQIISLRQTIGSQAAQKQILEKRNQDAINLNDIQLEKLINIEQDSSIQLLQKKQVSMSNAVGLSLITLLSTLGVLGLLFYSVYKEIIARRQLASSLEQERDFTIAVLDTVGALVIVLDPEGKIIKFNRECERVTGYHYEEVRNQSFWKIFLLPEDIESVRSTFSQSCNRNSPSSYENYWITKNGEHRLIAWSTTTLLNGDNKVDFVIGTGLDISDRKQVEEEIRIQNWRSLVFSRITLRIRQSLDINEILNTTVSEVRKFLKADRVIVYRFNGEWEGTVVVESVEPPG